MATTHIAHGWHLGTHGSGFGPNCCDAGRLGTSIAMIRGGGVVTDQVIVLSPGQFRRLSSSRSEFKRS